MKRFKLFGVCIFAILVMIACQPDYTGIMEDPNNPYLPGNRAIDSYEKLVSAIMQLLMALLSIWMIS